MDEPLSNLDAKLRVETRANIADLQARLGTTTVYVTHDQVEAMTMGNRVAVLKDGILQQVDTPRNLYDRPCNSFVAGFIGSPAMNLREVKLVADGATLGGITMPLPRATLEAAKGLSTIILGMRPEAFTVESGDTGLALHVKLVEELGADAYIYGTLEGDAPTERPFVIRASGIRSPNLGDTIHIGILVGEEHAFNPETGARLG
jgi:multiple sugar transport system ATP-binding protein